MSAGGGSAGAGADTEPVSQPSPPETLMPAVEPDVALARKNNRWAWALLALFLLLFGGTFLVAEVYLWLS